MQLDGLAFPSKVLIQQPFGSANLIIDNFLFLAILPLHNLLHPHFLLTYPQHVPFFYRVLLGGERSDHRPRVLSIFRWSAFYSIPLFTFVFDEVDECFCWLGNMLFGVGQHIILAVVFVGGGGAGNCKNSSTYLAVLGVIVVEVGIGLLPGSTDDLTR